MENAKRLTEDREEHVRRDAQVHLADPYDVLALIGEVDALRAALAEACDGWEDASNYAGNVDPEDEAGIARLRALLPDPKMHWREGAK